MTTSPIIIILNPTVQVNANCKATNFIHQIAVVGHTSFEVRWYLSNTLKNPELKQVTNSDETGFHSQDDSHSTYYRKAWLHSCPRHGRDPSSL
jgi:hypothetical protein